MRRSGMRRLRASFASSHSGGAGAPLGTTKSPRQELAETRPVSYRGRREARPGADKTLPDGAPRGGCAMRMSGADCVNCLRVAQHHRTGLRFPAHRPPSSFSATRAVRGQ